MGDGVEVNKLNKTVMFAYHRNDMGTTEVNLKAVNNFGSSNDWGFYMPKSGTVRYITISVRGGVPGTEEQIWTINNNNDMSTAGEYFEFSVQKGGTQVDTGVTVDAHMVIAEGQNTNHSTGSMVVNHTFNKGDEIRIQRTDASVGSSNVNMYRAYGQIYVEFD